MTTKPTDLAKYGAVNITTAGRARWDAQEPSGSWSDEGELDLYADSKQRLKAILEKNVLLGVSEYLGDATAHVTVVNGELKIAVCIENDVQRFYALIPLNALLTSAIKEIRPRLGVDAAGQSVLSQIVAIGRQIATITEKQRG